jgi:predicted nucleic acid-binding protein
MAHVHAELRAGLQGAGTVIGAHDLWITATALAHGMDLLTARTRDFDRIPGLSALSA